MSLYNIAHTHFYCASPPSMASSSACKLRSDSLAVSNSLHRKSICLSSASRRACISSRRPRRDSSWMIRFCGQKKRQNCVRCFLLYSKHLIWLFIKSNLNRCRENVWQFTNYKIVRSLTKKNARLSLDPSKISHLHDGRPNRQSRAQILDLRLQQERPIKPQLFGRRFAGRSPRHNSSCGGIFTSQRRHHLVQTHQIVVDVVRLPKLFVIELQNGGQLRAERRQKCGIVEGDVGVAQRLEQRIEVLLTACVSVCVCHMRPRRWTTKEKKTHNIHKLWWW